MVSFGVINSKLLFKRGSMKNLVKVMFGGIIGASVLAGGVALAHGWAGEGYGWGHGGIYGSGCRNLQQVPEGYGRWGQRGHCFPGMLNHGFQGRMYGGSGMG